MAFELTPEQRTKLGEVIGVENVNKVFDEKHVTGLVSARDAALQTQAELNTKLAQWANKVPATQAEIDELATLREEIKKNTPADVSEKLEAQRVTLKTEHEHALGVVNAELDFWRNKIEDAFITQPLLALGSKYNFNDEHDVFALKGRVKVELQDEQDPTKKDTTKKVVLKVYDEDGKQAFSGKTGTAMTLEEMVGLHVEKKPYLVKKGRAQGSGSGGGEGASGGDSLTVEQQLADAEKLLATERDKGNFKEVVKLETKIHQLRMAKNKKK